MLKISAQIPQYVWANIYNKIWCQELSKDTQSGHTTLESWVLPPTPKFKFSMTLELLIAIVEHFYDWPHNLQQDLWYLTSLHSYKFAKARKSAALSS